MTARLTRGAKHRQATGTGRPPALPAGAPSVAGSPPGQRRRFARLCASSWPPRVGCAPPRCAQPGPHARALGEGGRSRNERRREEGEIQLQGQKCVCGKLQVGASAERDVYGAMQHALRPWSTAFAPPAWPRQSKSRARSPDRRSAVLGAPRPDRLRGSSPRESVSAPSPEQSGVARLQRQRAVSRLSCNPVVIWYLATSSIATSRLPRPYCGRNGL